MSLLKTGVGLNLRLEFIDEFIARKPNLPFLEVIVDNWLSDGPHHKKLEVLRQDYEISFHCVGMNLGGMDALNCDYISSVKRLANKFKPFQISDHICLQKNAGICFHDLLPIPFNESSLLNISERVNRAQEILGESILLENLSYYTEFQSSTMSEIEFINSLADRSGAKILLDLNNLLVNSRNLNHSIEFFLETLHWENVQEIHIAGAERQSDIYVDNHGVRPETELLGIAKNWIHEIQRLPVLYERDKNLPEFEQLIDEAKLITRELFDA